MKTGVMLNLVPGLIVALIIFCVAPCGAQSTIGIIAPLTGHRASIGEDARAGAAFALERMGHEPDEGKCGVTLQFEDSRGTPAGGISAFEKLAAEGVRMVVTQNSNVSLPISPLANRAGVLQLAISTTSDAYSTPDDFTFRTNGGTEYEAEALSRYLAEQSEQISGDACAAVLTMEDEYPRSVRGNLMPKLLRRNVNVCAEESFVPGETDYRSILAKIVAKKVKTIACLGYQVECGMLVKQLRQVSREPINVIGITPINNREFFEAAGPAAEGTAATHIRVDSNSPAAKDFKNKIGREPNVFSANAYDSVLLFERALEACQCRPEASCLKSALFRIKQFQGLSGNKGFDDRFGDMRDEYEILKARDGAFVTSLPHFE